MVAILGFTRERVIVAVREMYTAVANAPGRHYHFPVGRRACHAVGYEAGMVEGVPPEALEAFAGVGCPFRAGVIRPGDTVLDVGAGAGTDSCVALRLVGGAGRAYALDMTPAMVAKLRALKDRYALDRLEVLEGGAEAIPLDDESVDVVTSNGVLNLVPDKRKAVAEIFRVLRPGGRVQVADIVIARPVDADCRTDPRLWAECVVGATVDEDYLHLFRDAGFEDVSVLRSHDYFALSGSADTREIASRFGARAVELRMRRGAHAPARLARLARRADPRRAFASLQRRGLAGSFALGVSVATCYGSLAAGALLSLAGVQAAVSEVAVGGAVVAFAALATVLVGIGARHHGAWLPVAMAAGGTAVIAWTLSAAYHPAIELAGFAMAAAGVALDFRLRRRALAREGSGTGRGAGASLSP